MRSLVSAIGLSANLQCEFDCKPFSITASSRQIIVDIPDLTSCFRMLRSRPGRSHFHSDLARLNLLLNELQSTVELHINGTCIAVIGFETGAPLESLLGFKQFKLRPLAILKAALRSY